MTIQQFHRTLYRATLFAALAVPLSLGAQQEEEQARKTLDRFPRYTVEDLGTLGGPYSFSYSLNDAGVVTGGAATASQTGNPSQEVPLPPQIAFISKRDRLRNLGTLGGPNSTGVATNLFKLSIVDSETASLSRQGEDVCDFGTSLQCLAAAWKHGRLTALQPLPGGNNSSAFDVNDRGQAVGFSDTDVYEPDCAPARTAGFQFQSVIWEPDGTVHKLAPPSDDSVAFAFGINNRGQTVGGSGVCGNTTPPPSPSSVHAVLWESDGTPVNLGSLGGPFSSASAINSRGDVAGTSAIADGSPQAFLWTPETRTLLQLQLPGGFVAAVNPCCKSINDRREIVGLMFDAAFNSHAFLWKNGATVDLNDLIPKRSPWMLQIAASINASGQIAGQGLIHGEVHAFLATPCHRHDGRGECCENHDR